MKTIKDLREDFYLGDYHTGGNCMALCGDLSTLQNYILVTGNDCEIPTDESELFVVGVYKHDGNGEPFEMWQTTDVDHLYQLVQACFTLWGN